LQACGAPAMAGRVGPLEERVMRILGRPKQTGFPGWAGMATLGAGVVIALTLTAQEKPTGCASEPEGRAWLETKVQWIIQAPERAAFLRLKERPECEQFIKQFWERRGAAAKVEHERRMKWAAERYPKVIDAQRVYVVHGPPDEIESHPVEGFDKWRYRDLPGYGKNFDFTFRTK
jgi:GWxTD domain-containing protein